MYVDFKIIVLENKHKKLQYASPDVVYRDCKRNKKIIERIIGFKIGDKTIFASFDGECDMRSIDELLTRRPVIAICDIIGHGN
jgi:hypothetical protein